MPALFSILNKIHRVCKMNQSLQKAIKHPNCLVSNLLAGQEHTGVLSKEAKMTHMGWWWDNFICPPTYVSHVGVGVGVGVGVEVGG